MLSAVSALRALTRTHTPVSQVRVAAFHKSAARLDFHFDTHHFVQRLEREGLNRQQAEGIMAAMAEVVDESIRNMTANMVTKADQEKVRPPPTFLFIYLFHRSLMWALCSINTSNKSTLRSSSLNCI